MPVVIVKKVVGMPDVLHITSRGTDEKGPFEERVEITRGVPTKVSDTILATLKRSDHEHVEVVAEETHEEKKSEESEPGAATGTGSEENAGKDEE